MDTPFKMTHSQVSQLINTDCESQMKYIFPVLLSQLSLTKPQSLNHDQNKHMI